MIELSQQQRGAYSQAIAKAYFLGRGWQVFHAEGEETPVDFVVYKHITKQLHRVQAKTGPQEKSRGKGFRVVIHKHDKLRNCKGQYLIDDFDLLTVADKRTDLLYIIPWAEYCKHFGRPPKAISFRTIQSLYPAEKWVGWLQSEPTNGAPIDPQLLFDFGT